MAIRHHKTKEAALKTLKSVTPKSFGAPNRKLKKSVWKTKEGWTSSVRVK